MKLNPLPVLPHFVIVLEKPIIHTMSGVFDKKVGKTKIVVILDPYEELSAFKRKYKDTIIEIIECRCDKPSEHLR